ncbi:hypothetical protein FOXYS1_8828, partial [Fusarium oxysporum]
SASSAQRLWRSTPPNNFDTFTRNAPHIDSFMNVSKAPRDALDRQATVAVFTSAKPYSLYEEPETLKLFQMLNSAYKPPNHNRVASFLDPVCLNYQQRVKALLDEAPHLNVVFDASDDISSNRIINASIEVPSSVSFTGRQSISKIMITRLRIHQQECYRQRKAFIAAAITGWGAQLAAVKSVFDNKDALRAFARDSVILNGMKQVIIKEEKQVTQPSLSQVISYINDLEFWANLEMLFKVLQPIGHAQANSERDRAGLGEVIPRWLSIQASWDALKEAGQDPLINYQELKALRKQRFDVQTDDIHYMAFALDPATTDPKHHLLTTDILRRAHNLLEENTNAEEYCNIFQEFCQFRAREGKLFDPGSRIYRAASEGTPYHQHVLDSWRYLHSMNVSLAALAKRVLGALANSAASYGFTIHQDNSPIFDGSCRLGPAEVFNAEATGALEGIKALNLRESASQNIFICLDNLAAATCLRGTPPTPLKASFSTFRLWRHRMEPHRYAGCQDTPTSPATNEPINRSKQHRCSLSPKGLDQRWLICGKSRDRIRKRHSRRGGPPPLLSSTRDSVSRQPQAVRRSSRSRAQPCTICWQRDPFTGTLPHTTRDLTTSMHAWSAHATDSKHRTTFSIAERYRRVIG